MIVSMKYLLIIVALGFAGCSSTRLDIKIKPSTASIDRVSVDDAPADRVGPGSYLASVGAEEGVEVSVRVRAVSSDGVEAQDDITIFGGAPQTCELVMPAVVRVRTMSGTPSEVRIDNTVIQPGAGARYQKEVFPGSGTLDVRVSASSADGITDEGTVSVSAGQMREVELFLSSSASFTASREKFLFGEEIEFDASRSTPSGSIVRYEWNFGDGHATDTSTPITRHRYDFDPDRGMEDVKFVVTLNIVTRNGLEDDSRRSISGTLDRKALALDAEIYPRNQPWFNPGTPLQFKLEPRSGFTPDDIVHVSVDFGDGTSTLLDNDGREFAVRCANGECEPLLIDHTYERAGRFRPHVTYSHAERGLEGPFEAKLFFNGQPDPELAVVPDYMSNRELEDQAWDDAYLQLDQLLEQQGIDSSKPGRGSMGIALTSLTDANFETQEPPIVSVIDRFTHMMVRDGYSVMERKSAVLSRLAFEAVVDIREEVNSGVRPPDESDERIYRSYLDYGLVTSERASGPGLHYGVRVEGTSDRIMQVDDSQDGYDRDEDVSDPKNAAESASAREHRRSTAMALQNLPILVARFDTAEQLLAIEVLSGAAVTTVANARYDRLFDKPMTLRTARVALRFRLLDRNGEIVFTSDVVGTASDYVIPEYVPASTLALDVFRS